MSSRAAVVNLQVLLICVVFRGVGMMVRVVVTISQFVELRREIGDILDILYLLYYLLPRDSWIHVDSWMIRI